jgi:hypothetical protein
MQDALGEDALPERSQLSLAQGRKLEGRRRLLEEAVEVALAGGVFHADAYRELFSEF